MSLFSRPEWPHCDSPAPAAVAGEKDACGVGFLASLKGEASHWLLRQALRGLDCMEHRGGCGGDGDSGDGAGVLCGIPWSYLEAVWPEAAGAASSSRGLGMVFLPADPIRCDQAKAFCAEEAAKLGLRSLAVGAVGDDEKVVQGVNALSLSGGTYRSDDLRPARVSYIDRRNTPGKICHEGMVGYDVHGTCIA